jgi:bifunctional non-homologous end joining protein LigD
MPAAIGTVAVPGKDGPEDYISLSTAAGLVAAAQMGTIEFHIWGARNASLERPDRIVFDLDPDESLGFGPVRTAACDLRDRLDDLGLPSVPMLSGGKGIHVIAPLDETADWPKVKSFADRFSRAIAEAEPEVFTANIRKAQRKGRIFLDWLRNQRGATAVSAVSLSGIRRPTRAAIGVTKGRNSSAPRRFSATWNSMARRISGRGSASSQPANTMPP